MSEAFPMLHAQRKIEEAARCAEELLPGDNAPGRADATDILDEIVHQLDSAAHTLFEAGYDTMEVRSHIISGYRMPEVERRPVDPQVCAAHVLVVGEAAKWREWQRDGQAFDVTPERIQALRATISSLYGERIERERQDADRMSDAYEATMNC